NSLASTYAGATDGPSKQFTFADNGSYTVYGRIFDKDGGSAQYTTTVAVNNVAPTAGFSNGSGTINEGGSAVISFTNPGDVSTTDTQAGFHYSFAQDAAGLATTYATAVDSPS